ncbi:uncharacterized protein MICPUCDRAFT_53186 [Micromonas pusilla CCMP1545]|uniref:Predicted protein n=1 Tax=Micromonas pusilla (strain CCMP1545) TaxID=564608 RepID=C1N680_MICPC|nr:uncharacterized protein MICPUCDRAFT_53186 [Micromonas pusilla CCMP1545]EEH52425.1 predicted protein [Micromonas pusilla CCMP1545]|eukprot:XP_003063289.1 predicted protein [Micromonas pusilla CCMP1545]
MSARTALLNLARRAGAAPTRVARRNMSGGGTVEEEIGASPPRADGFRSLYPNISSVLPSPSPPHATSRR